jgi:phosphomannomutase
MSQERSLRISQVGLRGIVGNGLTASHVLDFAAAFGSFLGNPPAGGESKVILGRDPRTSGVMMREGVIAGLLACGHQVVDLGIVSTPVIQHSIRRLDASGGISIGASHNAAEWNALKFFGPRGTYLSTAEAGELLDIYHLKRFDFVDWRGIGVVRQDQTAVDHYLDDIAGAFDLERLSRFRVLVDCTSGTSGAILQRLNERFGTRFILINEPQDGRAFAHEPSTTKKMAALQLAPLVTHVGADAGFLFDIDSDRIAFATEEGEAASEEMSLVLLADELLERGPGKLVITSISTTALLEDVAARHGGTVVRVAVGRQAAIDALSNYPQEQIAVAGEGTGAVMMPRFRFVYDGIASMLAILAMMDRRGLKLSQILDAYPRYSILKGQIPLETHRIPEMLIEIERRFPDGQRNSSDGLRIDWPGQWMHVRVSQTEPLVRVICERRGDAPRQLFDQVMDLVRSYSV